MSNRVVIYLDQEDAMWLYKDLITRQQAIPSMVKMAKSFMKGRKLKDKIAEIEGCEDHFKSVILDLTDALELSGVSLG